ncbi:DUF1707 SHOCT-like domain-containing protein [Rhodococcoides corynebacterioides]|uniref:DUF1707 domain-containing protein n=1 Tax=Rhodococcoides corynebacterioides TaxID=53972 RepID=A0ABS7PC24_9NOCA|nr:DUF1707 domain-containing protein [Rhodococcus corynebacterioides]MBY6368736.1 DUF1707 domain-containing protein [Rhodococcus corynebacterioides]MBY6409399.1 DUF1707 domain-containing protein [Rhodococcus corynebacterioides]
MTGTLPSPTPLDDRIGRTLDTLAAAVGDGRLTLDEFDRRSAAAVAATDRGDLDALLRDLPPAPPRPVRVRTVLAAAWAHWALVNTICLTVYLAICLSAGEFHYPWPVWVLGPWGAVLAVHTVGTTVAARRGVTTLPAWSCRSGPEAYARGTKSRSAAAKRCG